MLSNQHMVGQQPVRQPNQWGQQHVDDHLGAVRQGPILAVTMLLKVKVGQAADVPHSLHKDSIVTHKVQDGMCAVRQGEVEHEGGQHYACHLLHKQAGLAHKSSCFQQRCDDFSISFMLVMLLTSNQGACRLVCAQAGMQNESAKPHHNL